MSVYTRCHVCEMDINTEYKDVYLEECGHSVCERCHLETSDAGRCSDCKCNLIQSFFNENASQTLKEAVSKGCLKYELFLFMEKFHRVDL